MQRCVAAYVALSSEACALLAFAWGRVAYGAMVLLVGAVHCEPLAVAQLPPEIRQQARVTRLLQERALIAATPQTAAAGGTP